MRPLLPFELRQRLLLLAMGPLFLSSALAAAPHPFTVEDLVAFERISEPAVSPDGERVAFTVSTLDLDGNRRRKDLWMADVQRGGARPFTAHGSAQAAAFSRDGKWVYFLSARSGTAQVWRIAVDGGEAEPVTHLPLEVGSFRLSPDGKRLAVSLAVFPSCRDLACTKTRLEAAAAQKSSGQLFEGLFIRHWDTWSDGRRSHLFVLPVGPEGSPVDVMAGMDADCPSKPDGGPEDYTFTPDGRSLVFSARNVGREEAWSTNFDLFLAPIDGSAPPKDFTASNPAWDAGPVFSPDGRTLLYRAMARAGYESDRWQLVLRDWSSGRETRLAPDWDRSPQETVFSPDGRTVFAAADDLGNRALFAIDVASGKTRTLVASGHVTSPGMAGTEVVFSLDSFQSPAELWRVKPDGSGRIAITALNAARLATVKLGQAEAFTFRGADGDTVHAWLVKPVDFQSGRRVPVAFLIHGGPQGSFSNDFHYRWNPQVYAGAGYAALMVDFHGSTGYGQAFTDAIRDDWGGKPFVDLQKGFAAALEKYPFLDGDRACALGASFGGYMVNWIAGKWPDRFRCLVTHDGNLDERMAYFETEELWFPEWEHRGTPWTSPERYAAQSPVEFVKYWKTPMLVIHGGKDYRIVDSQGAATFTALQRLNIPSRFLYFPDENHWVLKPANSILWHHTVVDWLDLWTKAPVAK
ncbi:MAG: LpqB family beta-propeller domain-containing protein [Myxococcaceae bacterium]